MELVGVGPLSAEHWVRGEFCWDLGGVVVVCHLHLQLQVLL